MKTNTVLLFLELAGCELVGPADICLSQAKVPSTLRPLNRAPALLSSLAISAGMVDIRCSKARLDHYNRPRRSRLPFLRVGDHYDKWPTNTAPRCVGDRWPKPMQEYHYRHGNQSATAPLPKLSGKDVATGTGLSLLEAPLPKPPS